MMEKYSIKKELNRQSELMYVNEFQLRQTEDQIREAEKALNEFVSNVISVIGKLPEEKIKELQSNAICVIQDELKVKYPFPNADDHFNLNALGINPEPLYAMHMSSAVKWQPFKFEFTDGKFIASKEQIQIDACYVYADTPEKKKFFAMVNQMMDSFREMKDAQLLRHYNKFDELFIPNLFKVDMQGNISLSTIRLQNIMNDIGRGITISV
ncbi:hypothetical protein [Chryseobacterium sp.]|uniref:hypothetical protein n=1 Tax=Chryseobacterium sp. TaxID=1871047 RepID=UPI0011C91A8D|nr:hypothetical protein [Chryseobacterium sp.]TXF75924.1 hypothetical protein FUA25_08445 [Chryseobacterium sp.]